MATSLIYHLSSKCLRLDDIGAVHMKPMECERFSTALQAQGDSVQQTAGAGLF